MIRSLIVMVAAASAALSTGKLGEPEGIQEPDRVPVCDLARVESGLLCSPCDRVLDDETTREGRFCVYCYEEALDLDVEPVPATPVQVCVKTWWACSGCSTESAKAGVCPECEQPLVQRTDRALVEFACPKCGEVALRPGTCVEPDCEGARLEPRCTQAGIYPHVSRLAAKT